MQSTEIDQLIKRWNPHFITGKVERVGIAPRSYYLDRLWEAMSLRHIIILTGVRRSGKSTLMQQMMAKLIGEGVDPKNVIYLHLEDPLIGKYLLEQESTGTPKPTIGSELLQQFFDLYRETYNPQGKIYMFLDEIQGISGFNRILNNWYERRMDLKCIMSGSRQSLVKSEMATLLTGRNVQFHIHPFNFREYLITKGVILRPAETLEEVVNSNYDQIHAILHHLGNYLHEGGFPEIVTANNEGEKSLLATSYYQDFLARDIVNPNQIRSYKDAEVLGLQILADFTKSHTYRSLAKPLNLTSPTVKSYLEYFYQAYLFYESNFFSFSTKNALAIQRERKIFVVDNGLRNYNSLFKTEDVGKCAENLVYLELIKQIGHIFYWKGKQEIDFVVRNPEVSLYNVTYTDDIPEREITGLIEGMTEFHLDHAYLLTKNTKEERVVDKKKIYLIPLWAWLLVEPKKRAEL